MLAAAEWTSERPIPGFPDRITARADGVGSFLAEAPRRHGADLVVADLAELLVPS